MWWWLSKVYAQPRLVHGMYIHVYIVYSTAYIDIPTRNLKRCLKFSSSKMELVIILLSKIRSSSSVLYIYESLHYLPIHSRLNRGIILEATLSPFHIQIITKSCWFCSCVSLQTSWFSFSSPSLQSKPKLQLHPLMPRWLHWLPR